MYPEDFFHLLDLYGIHINSIYYIQILVLLLVTFFSHLTFFGTASLSQWLLDKIEVHKFEWIFFRALHLLLLLLNLKPCLFAQRFIMFSAVNLDEPLFFIFGHCLWVANNSLLLTASYMKGPVTISMVACYQNTVLYLANATLSKSSSIFELL